jgi:hypothetical protein
VGDSSWAKDGEITVSPAITGPGTYTVTATWQDTAPPTDGNDNGGNASLTLVLSEPCECGHPQNFRMTNSQWDSAAGVLKIRYDWDSSTGEVADLLYCYFREFVDYPGDGVSREGYEGLWYQWPAPWQNQYSRDPLVGQAHVAVPTYFEWDEHSMGSIGTPYQAADFVATQRYEYRCGQCMGENEWITLLGGIAIEREIHQVQSNWEYRIKKHGITQTKILP